MSIRIFRTQIETLLAGLIGDYTRPSGATTPAIEFRDGNEPLDENTAVEGLEVILELGNPLSSTPVYSGVPQRTVYIVRLVQWSGYNYEEALLAIKKAYANCRVIPINVPPEIGPTKQCMIEIPSSVFQLPEFLIDPP